jgi:predicted alpha/beta superfamily hydrolase
MAVPDFYTRALAVSLNGSIFVIYRIRGFTMRSSCPRSNRFATAIRIGTAIIMSTAIPAGAQTISPRPQVGMITSVPEPIPALLPLAVQFDIKSVNTGRTYKIYLAKPVVPAPATGYGVLYVLDADPAFPTAASQAFFASALDHRRPLLVVGIGYPDAMAAMKLRTRDLTPYVPDAETAGNISVKPDEWGGGDAFHKFMLEELRPVIERMAAVDKSDQSLMGYSLGGLFALHILLTSPESYKTYVIGSPSVWWNGKQVLQDLPSFAKKVTDGKVSPRILITSDEWEQSAGSRSLPENYKMVDNARQVAETLQKITGRGSYRVDYILFPNETHNSGIPASTSRGVAFVESPVEGAGKQ